jgi:DNA (cytosine-5)-methyltransferase 1
MTHGSLFSGIGGFDLAASWMGWENIFHCERDEFGQKVLAHHFPNSKLYDDVRTMDANKYRGRIDVLSGGFPCQPFSLAGNRKGKEDERHLWPSMLRVIRECRPRYVVGENVKGLVGWSDGMVLEEVCVDLENIGYSVQPYLIPACAKNAPHQRMRVWFVAYSNDDGTGRTSRRDESEVRSEGVQERDKVQQLNESDSLRGSNAPDTDSSTGKIEPISRQGQGKSIGRDSQTIRNRWEEFPTVTPVCGGDDGLPEELDGITFPKWRRQSVAAYGNAIVPQIAHSIFEAIDIMDREFNPLDVN